MLIVSQLAWVATMLLELITLKMRMRRVFYGYIYRDRNRDLVCSSYDSADNWIHPRPVADSFSDSGTILSSTLQLPKPIKHILKLSASYEKAVLRIPFVRSECPELTVVGNHLKT